MAVCGGKAMGAFGKRLACADGKRRFPGLREVSIACVSIPQAFPAFQKLERRDPVQRDFGSFFGLEERTTMRFIFKKYKKT